MWRQLLSFESNLALLVSQRYFAVLPWSGLASFETLRPSPTPRGVKLRRQVNGAPLTYVPRETGPSSTCPQLRESLMTRDDFGIWIVFA
jgi:hypothetical protein